MERIYNLQEEGMFDFLKKKQKKQAEVMNLKAITDGKAISIEEVPDEIFSSKAMGDGVAFESSTAVIVAPCDCKVEAMSPDMNHAIGLKLYNGMEILIHIGIDTVKLEGEGFKQIAKEGMNVKEGDVLLEFDKELIRKNNLCDNVLMIITEQGNVKNYRINLGEVQKGNSIVVEW